jgi:hypothetical protein
MNRVDPSEEGFIHGTRLAYSVEYQLQGGSSIIVWFDPGQSHAKLFAKEDLRQVAVVPSRGQTFVLDPDLE